MSAGFEFANKHEITICGRAYPCDISDKRMLEGVTRDFPRVLQAAQAFCAMDAKLKPGGQDGRSADTMAQEALEKSILKCVPPRKAELIDANKAAVKMGMEYQD